MTNEQMLSRTYDMIDLTIKVANCKTEDEEQNLRSMLLSNNMAFGMTIDILKDDINKSAANKNGRSKTLSAMKRIIKTATQKASNTDLHGAWITPEGKQIVCSGYHVIVLNDPLPLTEAKGMEDFEQKVIGNLKYDCKIDLSLPSIADLKSIIADHKIKHKATPKKERTSPIYDFGENLPMCNAEYLLDMMEALHEPSARCQENFNSIIYFKSEDGEGLLLSIRKITSN